MPEPFVTIWLVVLAAGGYVAAIAVLLKDVLNVRKLQLEFEELREKSRTRHGIVHRVAAEEIEKYGRPEQSLYAARGIAAAARAGKQQTWDAATGTTAASTGN